MKKLLYASAAVVLIAIAFHIGAGTASGQAGNTLISMTDYPRLQYSAVAVDAVGGIYFGHLQQWTRVGTTPSRPVEIWSRDSDGGIIIALENGDLYQLGSPARPVGDWTLTYDSNVFSESPTSTQQPSWGHVKGLYRR